VGWASRPSSLLHSLTGEVPVPHFWPHALTAGGELLAAPGLRALHPSKAEVSWLHHDFHIFLPDALDLEILLKAGGKCLFAKADVAIEEEIADLVRRTVEEFGRLDFAFNNAGIALDAGVGIGNTAEVFDRTMNINVRDVSLGMKHEIPAILQPGGGAIVNNASLVGLKPSARSPIYSASKAAVISLTKSAALEFAAKGVRINAICAAIIETAMTERIRTDQKKRGQFLAIHPLGRFGRVEEVAAAVVYLCSPKAGFTTGVALPLDSGASA
jgi:NAD(P)-dependent dehydrogenase (short-subunit alcohol dehydrogenase family)